MANVAVMTVEDDEDGMAVVKLGSVTVTSSGDGLYKMEAGRVITVELEMNIEYEEKDGVKYYSGSQVQGNYDTTDDDDTLAYTDSGIEDGINEYLHKCYGIEGAVDFSEQGMQDAGYMHFDVSGYLVLQAMPDLKKWGS